MPAKKARPGPQKEPGSLKRYHAKRDFKATPEPRGAPVKGGQRLRFVIQ